MPATSGPCPASNPLCASLAAKIHEQTERTAHLIGLIPVGREPELARLLGHLLDCVAGFCAVLAAAAPDRLAHFAALRTLPVNHPCSPAEALDRIGLYRARINEGFDTLADSDLARAIPTVFVAEGEPVLTLLLGNLEHLINHKHELFTCIKQLGVPVATRDLYHFRGVEPAG
jgi:hypothetical protein